MAGYLDTYGVAEVKRFKLIKQIVVATVIVAVVALVAWLYFRNFKERQIANHFLDTVKAGDHKKAYEIWGCTAAAPCRDYNFERFLQDWGPSGVYAKVTQGKYTIEDACGPGVVFTLEVPGVDPIGIYVNRTDKTMSYAPWPRCPGRHLHIWEFIKSRFS